MKFCERFNISPLDYARIPQKKISLWTQMIEIESNVDRNKQVRLKGRKKL